MTSAPRPSTHPPRQTTGFTLVELLVVLVIITILTGLVVVGINAVLGGTIDRTTVTRMEMLNSMMAAHANVGLAGGAPGAGAHRLPAVVRTIANPQGGDPDFFYSTADGYHDSDSAAVTNPGRTRVPLEAPGASEPQPMLTEPAAARTQAVLRRLLSVPENASAYATLPDEATSGRLDTTDSLLNPANAGVAALDPPLLLDGHGQVIIYVPPSGLSGLNFRDGTMDVTIRAADGRAFWASAGADGDFTTGDDNVYSTTVIRAGP